MFVKKINNISNNQQLSFRGYQHEKNSVGEDVMRFNAPVLDAHIDFYKVRKNPDVYAGYEVIDNAKIASVKIEKNGTLVNLQDITDLDKDEAFAYQIRSSESSFADTGLRDYTGKYTIVSRVGTTPTVQGAACLVIPDSHRPGAYYLGFENPDTGKIIYDSSIQKKMENTIRTFSNKFGGNLAGLEYDIPNLSQQGIKILFSTPIAGGDNVSSHKYWNKNNMQIADEMGNSENFASFVRTLFSNGMKYVNDGTFTSEGLEGIHFQYALRWAERNPQTYYWFKMTGLKDAPLGLGVVPKNKENLRHRVVNPPVIYNPQTKKVEKNLHYDENKETYFQLYDTSQVSEEQLAVLDKPIETYQKIKTSKLLEINSHDDTAINYVFEVSPKEYIDRLKAFVDYNENNSNPIEENSPEGTIFIAQFSNFKLIKKTEGGFVAWDANTDMVKMNYGVSGYDEKINQAIVSSSQRAQELKLRNIGAYEVQDITLQAGKYWTAKVKDIQTLYVAQKLGNTKSQKGINELIKKGLLPNEVNLSKEAIQNVLSGFYLFEPKGLLDKDSTTIKALMKLPLDSLELGENTTGVLSTSYFSNRATSEDTLGLSRFELMQADNPHLAEQYSSTYLKMNDLFCGDIKNFAHEVIRRINNASEEKLLDREDNYTIYGEYVINLIGQDITKFALLKAIAGDSLQYKILSNGEITYNYKQLRQDTTLKSLGIHPTSPTDEANKLINHISRGLNKLSESDVETVVNSILTRISGTNLNSFRLAEAMVGKSGLGLDWRLDAAKDIIDMDAVRNGEMSFDDAWQKVIDYWKRFVQTIKKENPNSYIVAEITDVADLMKDFIGENIDAYDNNLPRLGRKFANVQDAMAKFFLESGIVSEAAYSYTFTDFLKTFSAELEKGSINWHNANNNFINRLRELTTTRSIDYIRNLYTFADNHDKPSVLHGMALDMELFYADLSSNTNAKKIAFQILTNSDKIEDVPIEVRLNFNNPEYYSNISARAISIAKLYRDIINEDLTDIADQKEIYLLKKALVDLVNANEKGNGKTVSLQTINNIPELTDLTIATQKMLELAGMNLPKEEIQEIVNKANEQNLIEKHLVDSNQIPSDTENLYVAALAGLIADAFSLVRGWDKNGQDAMCIAYKKFIETYPNSFVQEHRTILPVIDDEKTAMAKNAFAAKDFKDSIKALIEQAKFIAKEEKIENDKLFMNEDKILLAMYRSATEPAIQKGLMYTTFLSAFPGIATIFLRDMLGGLGFDEKSKNVFLQNRNATLWSELDSGPLKEYRKEIYKKFQEAISIRSLSGTVALNHGTPYILKSSDNAIPAYLMQDGFGNMTISLFNANGIDPRNRVNYFEKLKIENEEERKTFYKDSDVNSINLANRYVPIQSKYEFDYLELPEGLSIKDGTVFNNVLAADKEKYIARKVINDMGKTVYRLFRESIYGNKFVINGTTAKNGVMVLKHIAFKGDSRLYNKRYDVISNPYIKREKTIEGENLSILAK